VGSQRGGRGAGARGFSERGGLDSRVVERREPQPGAPCEPRQGEQGFGQIETWHPVGGASPGGGAPAPGPVQQPGAPGAPGEGPPRPRPRPGSNKDAFDNAGNWGDDFPAAEDWDNDEYTGSLSDTKVFTPSGAAGTKPSAIGEPVNGEMRSGGPSLQAPGAAPTPANNSLSGSSYSQPIDISALLQKPGGLSGAPAALSQYQQAATKDLKSAIGLAPGQGSLSYSSASAAPPPSFASAAPGSAFSPIKPAAVTNGSSSASKALPRARLPPPSKIPSSAVEMPGDSLSNLDVQFGGLDLQFGGSNNDSNSSNFDFGAGTPPGQKQDLENESPGRLVGAGLAPGPVTKPLLPGQGQPGAGPVQGVQTYLHGAPVPLSLAPSPPHTAPAPLSMAPAPHSLAPAPPSSAPAPLQGPPGLNPPGHLRGPQGAPDHQGEGQPHAGGDCAQLHYAPGHQGGQVIGGGHQGNGHHGNGGGPGQFGVQQLHSSSAAGDAVAELPRFSSIPPGPGKSESGGAPPPLDSYKSQGGQSSGAKEVPQSLSSALAAGIKQSSSTDSVPSYGRVGEREAGGAPRPDGKPAQYGGGQQQQRSPGPLLAKADNLGYNNGGSGYSGYQGGKASQGFPGSGYPGGFDRQPSGGYSAGSNGLSGSYGRGGGSSGYNPPREPSYSNSYGGGGGGGQAGGNFGSYGASTTNYSPYTANSSYSTSKSAAAAAAPSSQFAAVSTSSGSQYTESSAAGKAPYEGQQTSASSSYGGLGQSSAAATSASSLGLSASSSLGPSSSSKMSVNTASGKMVPGMPPGVPGVLPQQYLIGANAAAAGFPAYLANLGQNPAMAAAYGYGGVGGHQLEDLAALQRSTLAASLPQLVGSQPAAAAANQPTGGKAPNSGYYDPASQFGGNTGAAASLGSRAAEQPSSFPSDSSGKFGSTGDTTSSPVPSSVAQTQQPTPFNALASTFAAAAPQQHPTLPPGYAYFYGGVGGMGAQLAAAYGGGLPAAAGYPATHPGIPAPTVAGPTNTTQFQKQAYGSSYGNSYGDSLSLGQSNSYGKTSYGASADQPKSATGSNNTGHGYWSSTNGLW